MGNELYGLYDIACLTNLSVRTLRRLISYSYLKGSKVGGKWVFDINQIRTFLEKKESFPYISLKWRMVINEWLNSIHAVGKTFVVLTASDCDVSNIDSVLKVLLAQSKSNNTKVHYGRYDGVIHIAYFGDRDAVRNAINELSEKCGIE